MILILCHQHYEQGTDPVVEWLLASGADFRKLSNADLTAPAGCWDIDVERGDICLDGRSLRDEVSVVWFRRFHEPVAPVYQFGRHAPQLRAEIARETATLAQYLFYVLRDKPWLPDYHAQAAAGNKLSMLHLAHATGLRVPASKVVNTQAGAAAFYQAYAGEVVSKPLDFCGYYLDGDDVYTAYTVHFDADKLAALPNRFFPLLLQEAIRPRYELRVFYLDGTCYATAILGNYQAVPPGFIDIKLLFTDQQTHLVAYQLPAEVEQLLAEFMRRAGLNTGSIDLIRATDGGYVFLEVNPVGQYLAPSTHCHFALEDKIAHWLLSHEITACHV